MRSVALIVVLAGCSLTASPSPAPPRVTQAAPAPTPAPTSAPPPAVGLDYVVRETGGAASGDRLPLVVALHGLGDRPEDFVTLFEGATFRARVVALRAPTAYYDGFAWFPLGDADRDPGSFRRAVDLVAAAIPALARVRPTCGLPVVTGFSQGAMLAFAVAARSPSIVRGAVPIAGRLPAAFVPTARPLGGLLPEVVALHGAADARIALSAGDEAVRALSAAGFPATLTRFEGVGHAVPPPVRAALFDALRRLGGDGC